MIDRHLRVDDMKWVYNEGVLTDVDGDSGQGKEYSFFLYLNTIQKYRQRTIR
jgi:hypothetical protein